MARDAAIYGMQECKGCRLMSTQRKQNICIAVPYYGQGHLDKAQVFSGMLLSWLLLVTELMAQLLPPANPHILSVLMLGYILEYVAHHVFSLQFSPVFCHNLYVTVKKLKQAE